MLIAQFVVAGVAVLASLPLGFVALRSVAIGAGVCLIANLLFARRVFRQYRAQQPGELVLRMYGAEVLKIGLILALFALAFATIEPLNLPALLAAYAAVQIVPALFATRPDTRPPANTDPRDLA